MDTGVLAYPGEIALGVHPFIYHYGKFLFRLVQSAYGSEHLIHPPQTDDCHGDCPDKPNSTTVADCCVTPEALIRSAGNHAVLPCFLPSSKLRGRITRHKRVVVRCVEQTRYPFRRADAYLGDYPKLPCKAGNLAH